VKKLSFLAIIIVVAIFATVMVGCNNNEVGIEHSEARAIVKDLMSNASEINRIHYGEGLAHLEDESKNAYVEIDPQEKYKSLEEIKAFTRSVLSESYARELIESTFEGRYSAGGGVVTKARYIEISNTILVLRDIDSYEGIYQYDLDTVSIKETTSTKIKATVTTIDGNIKEVVCVLEAQGWRIDSTTY
jgi:hypothetical protein